MAPMAMIPPMTMITATATTATQLPMSRAAIRPAGATPTTHAPAVTAVFMEIRRRARSGGRRGRAPISSAGMSKVTPASSQLVRDASAWPTRASNSSRASRPSTNAALSRPITRSRSAREARRPAAAAWAPGSGLTSASTCIYSVIRPRAAGHAPATPFRTAQARRVMGAAASGRAGLAAPGLGCVALGLMLDRLALPTLPVLRGERVVLRDFVASDVDDRLRHPIDPEEEDGYGSSWRREWNGERYHTREYLLTTRPPPQPGAYEWAVEHDGHCVGSAGLEVNREQHCAEYTVGLFVASLRGRGLGRDITRLVLSWAFGVLGVHRVELEVLAFNRRAITATWPAGSAG